MFLNLDNKNKNSFNWIIIHMLVGGLSTFSKFVLIAWFYLSLLWFGYRLITSAKHREYYLIYAIFYLSSFDVIARMSRVSPFIPHELSKYLLLPLLLYGAISYSKRWNIGFFMVVMILPAFFYDLSGDREFTDIVNYGFGPLILALSVAFFHTKKLSINVIFVCLRLFLYTSLMVLAFAFIKTPDYDKIEFTLAANFQTTGGFGSNQVANVLGLGAICMFLHFFYNKPLSGYRYLDLSLLGLFMLQALLTMSRGGVFTAVLAVLVFIYFLPKDTTKSTTLKIKKSTIFGYLIVFSIIGYAVFLYVDHISNNVLSKRYKGDTIGTEAGVKEKSLTTFTSNRFDLVESEIAMWADYPLFGVGVGSSRHLRSQYTSVITSSHTEFSRLLSDHGMLGLAYLISWLSIFFYINKFNNGLNRALLMTLFIIAFFTSTHSAMRVFITPLLTGLSVCVIVTKGINSKSNASI